MIHAFVIPAYGQSRHLVNCLESIVSQSSNASEVVITTSTPSKFLEKIAEKYRISLLVNPIRSDIASDWNFALTSTDASFVTVAHQDDWYAPDYSRLMLDAFNRHPQATIAFCNSTEHTPIGPRDVNANLRVKRYLSRLAFGTREAIGGIDNKRRLLTWGNPVCCPSVVFNRKLIPDFRFESGMQSNLDWDAWARLAMQPGEFIYVRTPMVSKGVHSESETSALIANQLREKEDRQMFDRFWPRPVAAAISTIYRLGYRSNRQ